jgi:hypothetical protein
MLGKTHVHMIQDDPNRIIVVRFGSYAGEDFPLLKNLFSAVTEPWLYDFIFDLRRFDGPLTIKYIGYLTLIWRRLSLKHENDRHMAIVTIDYNLISWLNRRLALLPQRRVFVFEDFDEGLDWIKAQRF